MNRMMGFGGGLHLVDDRPQPVLEFALHAGPGLEQPDVQRPQLHVLQHRRHVALGDPEREALGHGGLPHACLAGEQRVVLPTAHEDVDDLPDLFVSPGDGIDGAGSSSGREVGGEPTQRFLLAHGGR